jgi:hypothetical protein
MDAVLVGGPADGRRVSVELNQMYYLVPVFEGVPVVNAIVATFKAFEVHRERYDLFRVHPATRVAVFAHASLTPEQIMERLIEGYRQERR